MNRSFILDSPFFTFSKKHFCHHCGKILEIKKVSKIINSKSIEAKDFDFSSGDSYLSGDVEFNYHLFFCIDCDKYYSVKEIKEKEKLLKLKRKSDLNKREGAV